MGKILVITEKPSQARALRQGLRMNFQTNIYKNKKNNTKAQNTYYESDTVIIVPAAGHLFGLFDVPDYLIEEGIIERKKTANTVGESFNQKFLMYRKLLSINQKVDMLQRSLI